MKKVFLFLGLMLLLLSNCSSDDNNVVTPKFTVKFNIEKGYSGSFFQNYLADKDYQIELFVEANNQILDKKVYKINSESNSISYQFELDSVKVITSKVELSGIYYPPNAPVFSALYADATIEILNTNNQMVAKEEKKFLNSDSGDTFTFSYDTETKESKISVETTNHN